MRFYRGFPEKVGGWQGLHGTAVTGVARGIHAWNDLNGNQWIAIGTNSNLYVYDVSADTLHDITPGGYSSGPSSSESATAYGAGNYGAGPYGGGYGALKGDSSQARTWTLGNWGEDLIAVHFGGQIYQWDTSVGTGTAAAAISGSPTTANSFYVSPNDRHLVLLGAHDGTSSDPLNIRWCAQGDNTDWTPNVDDTAGSTRLETGSTIVKSIAARGGQLVLTDYSAYYGQYVGLPQVFRYDIVGTNCGIIGPLAGIDWLGQPFWMGDDQFFYYDGSEVHELPCEVRSEVFDNLNRNEPYKIHAVTGKKFGELTWYFPTTAGGDEISMNVTFNVIEQHWSMGTHNPTTIMDSSVASSVPVGVDVDGYLSAYETGLNQRDGSAVEYYLEAADLDIDDGEFVMHMNSFWHDFKRIAGDHSITFKYENYPQQGESSVGPLSVTSTTQRTDTRVRGRALRFRLHSDQVDTDFRLGTPRAEITGHGRRM